MKPPDGVLSEGPCACWVADPPLHDGHCCFAFYDEAANRVTCGHDESGMAVFREAERRGAVS